jgi:hypothetical protein
MPTSDLLILAEARAYLKFPNPTVASADDNILGIMISAASDVCRYHCGDVLPTLHVETYDGGACQLFLRNKPLLEVQSIQESYGYINYELDFQQVGIPANSAFAYSIDSYEEGIITRRSAGSAVIPFAKGVANVSVVYRAGRQDIPPAIALAVRELLSHWYSNSQLRAVASAGGYQQYDASTQEFAFERNTGTTTFYFGVPQRIVELINSERRGPIFA